MTGIIIQARTSSTRLKAKVLRPLAGKALIIHVLERCHITGLPVIVATSEEKSDDALAAILKNAGNKVYRGSLKDVQKRYIDTAEEHGFDKIIRVTGDNPLIDYRAIVELSKLKDIDYACVAGGPLGTGSELITLETLKRSRKKSKEDKYIEHVTLYVRDNIEDYRSAYVKSQLKDYKYFRLTVDEEDDYRMMKEIYKNLYRNYPIENEALMRFLADNPEISGVNSHVQQKI